jgi:ribosomal 50S subunit-associated protein YjgA (DUF615 family)
MHDKARPHIAGIVQQYLQEVQLPVLEWLARSPDMNPIEHVWDHLEQALKRHQRGFRNLEKLEAVLVRKGVF